MDTDQQLQQDVVGQLDWDPAINAAQVGVDVHDGVVTLAGHVGTPGEKWAAEQIVRNLTGVRGVDNAIAIKPAVALSAVKHDIEGALLRCARRDSAHRVDIRLQDDEVTLSGFVSTWDERVCAIHAAWGAPGVRNVVDEMQMRL